MIPFFHASVQIHKHARALLHLVLEFLGLSILHSHSFGVLKGCQPLASCGSQAGSPKATISPCVWWKSKAGPKVSWTIFVNEFLSFLMYCPVLLRGRSWKERRRHRWAPQAQPQIRLEWGWSRPSQRVHLKLVGAGLQESCWQDSNHARRRRSSNQNSTKIRQENDWEAEKRS